MGSSLCFASLPALVGKGPNPEVTPDIPPQPIEPLGLDDQKEDDQAAEHRETGAGNDVRQLRLAEDQRTRSFQEKTQYDRQQRDEYRAKNRAQNRAQPADDDHGEEVDRDVELELLVVGDAEIVGVEHPADAGVERRDGEGEQLVAVDVDADDLGGE